MALSNASCRLLLPSGWIAAASFSKLCSHELPCPQTLQVAAAQQLGRLLIQHLNTDCFASRPAPHTTHTCPLQVAAAHQLGRRPQGGGRRGPRTSQQQLEAVARRAVSPAAAAAVAKPVLVTVSSSQLDLQGQIQGQASRGAAGWADALSSMFYAGSLLQVLAKTSCAVV